MKGPCCLLRPPTASQNNAQLVQRVAFLESIPYLAVQGQRSLYGPHCFGMLPLEALEYAYAPQAGRLLAAIACHAAQGHRLLGGLQPH